MYPHDPSTSETVISHNGECTTRTASSDDNGKSNVQLTDQTNLLPFRKLIVVFFGMACCIVITTLDSTIVATALPTITSYFKAGAVSSWVPSASLLTSTAFQPLYGRFSDIFGRKATLCVAMGLFVTGSLASGLSRTIIELIIFRGVTGAGGGGIITLAQVIMSDVVSLRERGKYQGIIGSVVAFGYAVGPLLGGFLAQKVSWRWCFWMTIPVSALATGIVLFILPLKPVRGDFKRRLLVVDYLGSVLTLCGVTLVLLPLIWGGVTFPWASKQIIATLLSGIAILGIFCLWEWKGAVLPLVPMYIFRHCTVCGVYLAMFINGFIFWGSMFYIPQYFQVAFGYTPIRSGIFLLPFLVTHTATTLVAGMILSKTGRFRAMVYGGFSVWAISCGCISTLNQKKPAIQYVLFMILSGMGAGQTQQTTTVAAQASVKRSDMSVVTAVRNFIRFIGGTLALAVGSSILNNQLIASAHNIDIAPSTLHRITEDPTLLSGSHPGQQALNLTTTQRADVLAGYVSGFRIMFILYACLAGAAAVIAYFMIQHQELTREDDVVRQEQERKQEEMEMRTTGTVDTVETFGTVMMIEANPIKIEMDARSIATFETDADARSFVTTDTEIEMKTAFGREKARWRSPLDWP